MRSAEPRQLPSFAGTSRLAVQWMAYAGPVQPGLSDPPLTEG
jgi:hypothetical protein